MRKLVSRFVEPQPAPLMYPFGKGWDVMTYVRQHVFKRTDKAARDWFDQADEWQRRAKLADNKLFRYWQYMGELGLRLAGYAQYLTAMAIVALFVILQAFALVLWVVLSTLLILGLAFFNILYSTYYRIFVRCPDCHAQMNIPVYICPSCATRHSRLWPSPYGVFYHRCEKCETKLATLDLLGRDELAQLCVVCDAPMNRDVGRLRNVHIPVIGGPSTGKSNYVFMAMRQFIEGYARPRKYEVHFSDARHESEYESNVRKLESGQTLLKTPDLVPQAYNLAIREQGERVGRIVYLYDAAGEAFTTDDNVLLQSPYYEYVHGLIFIIDPFAIDEMRRKYENEIEENRDAIRPSSWSVMEAYERMLKVLETTVGLQRGKPFPHPIAVVATKTDVADLEKQIGLPAAKQLMSDNHSMRITTDAMNVLIRNFLIDHQLGNLVRDLEMQFSRVAYFSVSALGRMPNPSNQQPYEPMRVLDPLLWLLGEVGVGKIRKERIQQIDSIDRARAEKLDGILGRAHHYYWQSLTPTS